MIIRYNNSKKETIDVFVFADELDYWVDQQKGQVVMLFSGREHVVFRSKRYDRLTLALDEIHGTVTKDPDGFLDATKLGKK